MVIGKPQSNLERQVAYFIQQNKLFPRGSQLLLAVSGGPDSVCLLYILFKIRQELDVKLHIAHLDHQLRGKESESEADYVKKIAADLNVAVTTDSRNVKAYKKAKGISLEEAAREVRYNFLSDTAITVGADYIVTGHTLDDNAETLLLHLIRGTGTRGLIGLKPISRWQLDDKKFFVARPLLNVSRQQTVNYCWENEIKPRVDNSNLSLYPLRNRIRQNLLPLLESYNPGVVEALLRISTIAKDEIEFLDAVITNLWPLLIIERDDFIILKKERFNILPLALKRHLLRTVIENLLGTLKDIETGHIEVILEAMEKPAGRRIELPSGLILSIEYERFVLGIMNVNTCPYPAIRVEQDIQVPGITAVLGWLINAEIMEPDSIAREENPLVACFDLDKTGLELKIGHRKPGDRFQPLGMTRMKKLNEFMIDEKVPRHWRQRIPIVFSPEHILWLVGYRIDDRAKITKKTKKVLRLEFKHC